MSRLFFAVSNKVIYSVLPRRHDLSYEDRKETPPKCNEKDNNENTDLCTPYQQNIDNYGPVEVERDLSEKQQNETPRLAVWCHVRGRHQQRRRRQKARTAYQRIALWIPVNEGVAQKAAKREAHDARQHGRQAEGIGQAETIV